MSLRFYKPYTSGTRARVSVDFSELTHFSPFKKLSSFLHRSKGRNNRGIITIRGLGGGHKYLYRFLDFKRDKLGILGKVITIEYDPNRNSYICLLNYVDGEKRYILHPRSLAIGDYVLSDFVAPIKIGNALPLHRIPLGTNVHNIEFQVSIY